MSFCGVVVLWLNFPHTIRSISLQRYFHHTWTMCEMKHLKSYEEALPRQKHIAMVEGLCGQSMSALEKSLHYSRQYGYIQP